MMVELKKRPLFVRYPGLEEELKELFSAYNVMTEYDKLLKAHPLYKRFIEHTPFENDCSCLAFEVVKNTLQGVKKNGQ